MTKDYSPFTPGLPVSVEYFVGRENEINNLREKVAASTQGRLQVAFLTGERGIGKSSLASFLKYIVERDNRVLGLHTFLGGVNSLTEMVRRVFERLLKESMDQPWHEKVSGFFGNHIKKVGLFGVSLEFDATKKDLERLVHDFAPSLKNLLERLGDDKKGLFIILDDINGLASSKEFANWLKSLVDEIATSKNPLPLCLLLVGIDERRQSLISLQPSLARVLDLIEIKPWDGEETKAFYKKSFSKVGLGVQESALTVFNLFTGGLPVLGHEIGDAAFKVNDDKMIDSVDATNGVFSAVDIVGRKHLEPQVFSAIRSERYRTILKKIGKESFGFYFQKSEVRKQLTRDEIKVFDNFLTRMKKLGVVISEPDKGSGAYRFSNRLHYLYFHMEADRASKGK